MKFSVIAMNYLKVLFKEKSEWISLLIIPIAFVGIMYVSFSNLDYYATDERVIIGFADNDNSKETREILDLLKEDKMVNVREMNEARIRAGIGEGSVNLGVVLPDGFGSGLVEGKKPEIKLIRGSRSPKSDISQKKVEDAVKQVYIAKRYTEKIANELVSIEIQGYKMINKKYPYKQKMGIAFIAMFILFTVVSGVYDILSEKKNGIWQRILVSPTLPVTLFLGKLAGIFIRCWFQCAILLIFLKLIADFEIKNILASIVLLSVYIIACISIMQFIAYTSSTLSQYGFIAEVFVSTSCMLAGCWWPIEIVPSIMQKIALFTPQYWAINGLADTILLGSGFNSVYMSFACLLIFFSAFIILNLTYNKVKSRLFKIGGIIWRQLQS